MLWFFFLYWRLVSTFYAWCDLQLFVRCHVKINSFNMPKRSISIIIFSPFFLRRKKKEIIIQHLWIHINVIARFSFEFLSIDPLIQKYDTTHVYSLLSENKAWYWCWSNMKSHVCVSLSLSVYEFSDCDYIYQNPPKKHWEEQVKSANIWSAKWNIFHLSFQWVGKYPLNGDFVKATKTTFNSDFHLLRKVTHRMIFNIEIWSAIIGFLHIHARALFITSAASWCYWNRMPMFKAHDTLIPWKFHEIHKNGSNAASPIWTHKRQMIFLWILLS